VFYIFTVLLAVLFVDLVHCILLFALRLSRPSCNQTAVTAAPAATIVVVKQPQPTKPYTSQTSWKSYKEYFTRLALCNGWTMGVQKAQNLLIAMEGATAETVRGGLTPDKDEDYDLIWENLSRRFGHIDEPERAKRRLDNKKQLESETIEVFEQGLRIVLWEAWPTGDPKSKENDSRLKRRFIDGLFDPALQQFLRLHARTDDFVTTLGKARQYMEAQEQTKISAISKKPNVRFAATEDAPPDRIQPILDRLQKVLQTVLDNQNRSPEANVDEKVPGNGGPKKGKGKGNKTQLPANSDASTSTANPDFRYREQEPRGRPNEAARSRDDNQLTRWNEGRQGNQYNRSSSTDSQFRQPLQERDQQARGPTWNTGIPPGAADSRLRGQENTPFHRGCYVCGRPDCHSILHRNDRTPPPTSRNQTPPQAVPNQPLEPVLPQRVRDTFIPW